MSKGVVVFAALVLVGCATPSEPPAPPPSASESAPPAPVDGTGAKPAVDSLSSGEVVKQLADAYCTWAARCCTTADLGAVLPGASDHDSCTLAYEKASTLGADIAASVAAQRSAYSGEAAAKCVASIGARSCDELSA